jgi:hypothetical protein
MPEAVFDGSNMTWAMKGAKTAYALHSYHSRTLPTVLATRDLTLDPEAGRADRTGGRSWTVVEDGKSDMEAPGMVTDIGDVRYVGLE